MYRRNGPDLNLFESPSVTNSSDVPDSGFLIVYSTKLKLKKNWPTYSRCNPNFVTPNFITPKFHTPRHLFFFFLFPHPSITNDRYNL